MSALPINDGGPAFPHDLKQAHWLTAGMTLRDYFAAAALQGTLSNGKGNREWGAIEMRDTTAFAYAFADAMLKAREVKP